MKKTDIAMIVLIAAVSVLVSYFGAKALIGDAADKPVQVKTIEAISADVEDPDPTVFNKDAINPTVEVIIGQEATSSQSPQ